MTTNQLRLRPSTNFISTAATIGTNYKPNSHKTIGIYAEIIFAQVTAQSSYSLVITTKPDAGTINTIGVCVFMYLNNLSVVACAWDDLACHRHPRSDPEAPERQMVITGKPLLRRRHRNSLRIRCKRAYG